MWITEEVYLRNSPKTNKHIDLNELLHPPFTNAQKCASVLEKQGHPVSLITTFQITVYEHVDLYLAPPHLQRETNPYSLEHRWKYPLHAQELQRPDIVVA